MVKRATESRLGKAAVASPLAAGSLWLGPKILRQAQGAVRESQTRLDAILQSAMDAILTIDDEQCIVLFNAAAEKMFDCRASEALGGPIERFIPERFRGRYGSHIRRFYQTGPSSRMGTRREIWGRRLSGEEFPLEASISQVAGGGKKLFTIILRDITKRKRAGEKRKLHEQEIHKLNQELEERVAERTAQMEAANHELETFTYSVSHDLRAPLRHIGGFSKILIEDFGPAMDPEARRHLERIGAGVHRMGLLVDELLNLARVGRHAIKLQVTSLNSVIEEAVSSLQPEAEGRTVVWKIAKLPAAKCDPVLIKQVFQNLISNALKFTRPRERAVIEIGHREQQGETVIFVRDNGVGFNMKYVDKLFGVFQRLHRAEDFEGTGIGLARVQRIVHKHGGRVWAEAEPDKGATFCFTLGAVAAAPLSPRGLNEGRHSELANKIATAGAPV